jgi:hypothetical protein
MLFTAFVSNCYRTSIVILLRYSHWGNFLSLLNRICVVSFAIFVSCVSFGFPLISTFPTTFSLPNSAVLTKHACPAFFSWLTLLRYLSTLYSYVASREFYSERFFNVHCTHQHLAAYRLASSWQPRAHGPGDYYALFACVRPPFFARFHSTSPLATRS